MKKPAYRLLASSVRLRPGDFVTISEGHHKFNPFRIHITKECVAFGWVRLAPNSRFIGELAGNTNYLIARRIVHRRRKSNKSSALVGTI